MMLHLLLAALCLALLLPAHAFPPPKTCQISSSDPAPEYDSIPRATVNLDLAPKDRWTALATQYKQQVRDMVNEFVDHLKKFPDDRWENFLVYLDENQDMLLDRMPGHFGDEIRGIQSATELEMSSLLAFNLGYEIMGFCTSVVAQDSTGHTYHGRNLDFGLFLGFNMSGPNENFQWTNTELLRQTTVITDITRGGKLLYSSVSYIGYVGLLTGVRKGGVTVSVDTRFDDNYDKFLKAWLQDPTDTSSLLSQTLRMQIEDDAVGTDFETYASKLGATRLVGPAYAIIGGPKSGQGLVITIQPNTTQPLDTWRITDSDALPADAPVEEKFYVLQTNYDHWEEPPKIDDRQTAAYDCMDNQITMSGVSKESMYQLLAAMPNRNRLTTYTAIMDCSEGSLEATLQYCYEYKCSPW
jgi:acid ceramidase